MSDLRLSIIVPVFNEAPNLPVLAEEIERAMAEAGLSYEVILVDDGSTDGSLDALCRLAAEDRRLRVLSHGENRGQSAAFDAGFRAARGELLATLDADLQNDPAEIPRLVAELAGWDVVCGVRTARADSWLRRVSSRVANAVRNRLTGDSIRDVGCSLRVYRADLVRRVPMFDGMHRFLPTLLRAAGGRVTELPVTHRPRQHGASKYGVHNRLWRTLADLMAVRWMLKRWIDRDAVREATAAREGEAE